jgi:hypothetical protein
MKQTAVEWLIEQLENHNGVTRAGFKKCIEEAKDIERTQIVKAYHKGEFNAISNRKFYETGEQYYVKTYR